MFLLTIFIIPEEPLLNGQLHVTSIKRPLVGGPRVTRLWRLNCIYLWDHSFAHDELKCYVVFQLNSVLESLLSKVARYDQGSILAPMFSLMVCIRLRGRRQKGRERGRGREKGKGECAFLPLSLPLLCPHVFIRVCGRGRGGWEKRERGRGREKGRGECSLLPLPLPRSLPSLCLLRRLDMYLWNDCQNPVILPSRFQ